MGLFQENEAIKPIDRMQMAIRGFKYIYVMKIKYAMPLFCVVFTFCKQQGVNSMSTAKNKELTVRNDVNPKEAPTDSSGAKYELTYGSAEMGLYAYSFYLPENFSCGQEHGGSGVQCFSDIYRACEIPIDGNPLHQATIVLNKCQQDANALSEMNEAAQLAYFDKIYQIKQSENNISYQVKNKKFFILSGTDKEGLIFYEKTLLDTKNTEIVSLAMTYSPEFKTLYNPQIQQVFTNFD